MEWNAEQIQEIKLITTMQSILSELTIDNCNDNFNFLLHSEYSSSKTRLTELIRNIYEWSIYHPQKIYLYANLLKFLYDNSILFHEISNELIISTMEHIIFKNRYAPIEAAPLYLLVQCYLNNIINIQNIIEDLSQFLVQKRHAKSTLSAYFMFFAPEVESLSPDLYQSFIHYLEINNCSNSNHKICSYFDFFKEDNWSKLKLYRSHIHCMNPLLQVLIEDNVESLKQMSAHPEFDINQTLTDLPPLSPFYFLSNEPPLISAAAALSSVKCFKYLLLLNASTCILSKNGQGIASYAAIGGNLEILRILEQNGADFSGTLHMAVTFHHDDLFFWLHESKFPDLLIPSPQNKSVLGQAASSNNITVLKFMIDRGFDMNRIDEHGECALERAAYFGCIEFARILMWVPNIDVNLKTKTPPLCAAAFNGNFEIASMLLSHPFIEVNIQNGKNQTPLSLAASSAHFATFSMLLNTPGVDLDVQDISNSTLVHSVAMQNDALLASLVIKDCSTESLNKCISPKGTPFHIACMTGNIDVVKVFLMRSDLDINAKTIDGLTPLDQALRFFQIDVVNFLMSSTNAKATRIRSMKIKFMKKERFLNNIMSEIFQAINFYINEEDSKILRSTEQIFLMHKPSLVNDEEQKIPIV